VPEADDPAGVTADDLRARVATRIRALAKRRKLSLNALAAAAGISRAMLFRVLAGQTPATTDTLAKLANALRVDPIELLREPRQAKARQTSNA
jgi:transcriptional regulator with XRE-family HTH domain